MYGLILAVILVVVGFILLTMKFRNTGCAMISVLSVAIGIVWILLSVGTYIEMETKIPEYNSKKAYVEEQLNKSDKSLNDSIDLKAIQELKVNCNSWLLEAQNLKQIWGNWLLIPDNIMELELIKSDQ